MNDLWITKYKPQSLDDIISNHDSIEKIKNWLANFDKPNITSSIIISGNHGIGKTIIISLLLEQYNYEFEIISSNNIKNKKLLDEIINRFRKNNLYEMLHNITKKYAIIIDDTETISLISEKNNILELYKLNEDKKLFPLIFISSTHHCKLIIDIKKTAIEYRFTNPTTQQLKKFIKSIISNEELNIKSDSVLNKFINFSQYDIRRCISNLQDIFFTYGKELIDDHKFDIYMQLSKKKNVDIGLFEATNSIIQKYNSYNTTLQLYEYEKVLLPLMIYENYYKIIFDRATDSDTLDIMRKITESISIGDVIETNIYTDQNWYLQHIHGFYTCIYSSWLINSSLPSKESNSYNLEFSSDLNKTSLKNINKKNIQNLYQALPDKTLDDMMYLNKIIYHMISNNKINEALKLSKIYNLNYKTIEILIKIDKTVDKLILNPKLKKIFN